MLRFSSSRAAPQDRSSFHQGGYEYEDKDSSERQSEIRLVKRHTEVGRWRKSSQENSKRSLEEVHVKIQHLGDDLDLFQEEIFDGRAKVSTCRNTVFSKNCGTQTDTSFYIDLDKLEKRAEKEWEKQLKVTTKIKFEDLRSKYHLEMQALMHQLKEEKKFRYEQCQKVFEQWHENIQLQCTLQSTVKLPRFCTHIKDPKPVDLSITSRRRDPTKYMEAEATFYSQFQLLDEFSKKYEYKMQGKLKNIQEQV